MNNKLLFAVAVGVVVLIGVVVAVLTSNESSPSSVNTNNSDGATNEPKLVSKKACDLLTLDEAKKLLGENTTESSNTSMITSENISVDTCSYTNNGTTADNIKIVTVMARSALTKVGLDNNLGAFEQNGTANPKGAVAVKKFGDKAFWDPLTYQLAILDDNTWISIVYGGTDPTKNTLADAEKAATLVMN